MDKVKSFTDLIVWKKAHFFVLEVYKATKQFPSEEKYGLSDQLRRATVSITSNIVEGFSRRTLQDKVHFYRNSLGSLLEVQNQLLIARDLKYLDNFKQLAESSIEIKKLISGLIKSAQTKENT